MKRLLVLMIILCAVQQGTAQENSLENRRTEVNIPAAQSHTTEDIAAYINFHYDGESKKVAAIYNWLTSHIRYDADSIHYVILDEDNDQRVSFALRRGKGVCENFAAIFNDLCTKCGIPSFAIDGFTRQSGSVDRAPHVWCAAFVDGQWALYDPTWDAVLISNSNFFNPGQPRFFAIAPENFILTHLPFDPLFQFLNYPVTYREFAAGNTSRQTPERYFNFADSIRSFEKMDSLARYESALARIKSTGWPSSKIDTKLKRIRLQVEVLNQDSEVDWYDAAVSDYNAATGYLNTFIRYRNSQFQPPRSNGELEDLFQHTTQSIDKANSNLKKINGSKAVLVLGTGDLQKRLDDLASRVREQELFWKNYLAGGKEK